MEETAVAYDYDPQAKEVREASNIEKLTMELRAAIDESQKALEVLGQRITPVLRPESDKMPGEGDTPHPIRSPLADQLVGWINGVQRNIRRTHELIHLLDL